MSHVTFALFACATLTTACLSPDDDPALDSLDGIEQEGGSTPREICLASYLRAGKAGPVVNDDLDEVLTACPAFANALRWTVPDGSPFVWHLWPEAKKAQLRIRYQQYLYHADVGASIPRYVGVDRTRQQVLTEDQAFDLFAVNAAHALALEVNRHVPWSLLDFPESNLLAMFDSDQFVTPVVDSADVVEDGMVYTAFPRGMYLLPAWRTGGYVDRPQDGYQFLVGVRSMTGQDLRASTPDQTLANISLWVAQNMVHGWGVPTTAYPLDLAGRLRSSPDEWRGSAVVGGEGCHTTRDLLVDLARSINVPVFGGSHPSRATPPYTASIGHGAALYRWDSPAMRVLEHADDLNAYDLFPIAGFAPTDTSAEHARTLLEGVWPTTAEAARLSFAARTWPERLYNTDPRIEAAHGWGRVNQNAHRNAAYLIGEFGDETDTGSPRWQGYINDRSTQLGAARGVGVGGSGTIAVIDWYCSARRSDGVVGADHIISVRSIYPTVVPTDAAARTLLERYETLIARTGGCAAMQAARTAFERSPSPNPWRG